MPPSCWRNFTEMPKPTEAGWCHGFIVLAATAISVARPTVLWNKSASCWRQSRSWVRYSNRTHLRYFAAFVRLVISRIWCVSAEDIQNDCLSSTSKVFRYQKILQGTSLYILATAVSRSPSVLTSIEVEKAQKVIMLSGAAGTSENPKVLHLNVLGFILNRLFVRWTWQGCNHSSSPVIHVQASVIRPVNLQNLCHLQYALKEWGCFWCRT